MERLIEQPAVETGKYEQKVIELTKKFGAVYKRYGAAIWDELVDFTDLLNSKYPDAQDYRLYHIIAMLSGGDLVEAASKLDFPGDDSVEQFINELAVKYPVETKL